MENKREHIFVEELDRLRYRWRHALQVVTEVEIQEKEKSLQLSQSSWPQPIFLHLRIHISGVDINLPSSPGRFVFFIPCQL